MAARRTSAPLLQTRSALAKAPTGILGLDEATEGGLPRGRTTVLFGGPGSGKTVLALQTLVHGARDHDEPGILVAFEEDSRRIITNAASFGWNLPELQQRKLFFLDAQLGPEVVLAGRFDLAAMLASLSATVAALGAKRIVFDGIDVLLTLLDDPAAERAELRRLHDWVLAQQLSAILTAKAERVATTETFAQTRHGFVAYMADCAILLARRLENVVSERDLSVLKYRGSGFYENSAPFVIGPAGVEVAELHATAPPTRATNERLPTGIPRLDAMLTGGYLRAASVLITGLPGTAKSTLCGLFAEAVCRRKERTLYVSFDESAEEVVRNLASVKIQLQPLIDAGHLRVLRVLPLTDSAEIQLMRIRIAIRAHRASCVVIDPISATAKSSHASIAMGVLARFVHWAKLHGITLVCTSHVAGADPHLEATGLHVSTLCDTWIHLAYAQRAGERNRALTIVKSRGTGHSNQVRELLLGDDGVSLADVYQSGGEVFMGTMRWQQENADRDVQLRLAAETAKHRLELERAHAEAKNRLEVAHRELAILKVELEQAEHDEAQRLAQVQHRHVELMAQRGADAAPSAPRKPRGRLRTARAP